MCKAKYQGRDTTKGPAILGVFGERNLIKLILYIHLLVEEIFRAFVAHFEEKKNCFSLFKQEQRASHLSGDLLAQYHPLLN